MKKICIIFLPIILYLTSFSQDTCVYVSQQNQIGGLDCLLGSYAPYTADSYQWLNCDSSYSQIIDQTSVNYSGEARNVALEITYLGCIDTTYCHPVCFLGINELENKDKKLIKIIDYIGIETEDKPNTILIYIYSDGTKKKIFRIE